MKQQAKPKNKGFTLIELMVAMVVAIIVIGAIYAVYQSQTRVQVAQEVTLELQESLRAVLTIMEREIRTAGADPEARPGDPTSGSGARIELANFDELHFTRDIDDTDGSGRFDGEITEPLEDIRYELDGTDLIRETALHPDAAMQRSVLLDNVDALNFVYWGYDANNGLVVLNPGISNVDPDDYDDIKRIEVTIVSRSGQSDRGFLGFGRHTDSVTYTNQQELPLFGPENDNARRFRLTTSVTCRNMPK